MPGNLSPKGTVSVLCIDELVLDQSLDIMHWALNQSDPDGWLRVDCAQARIWIDKNDGPFKTLLDRYKYPNRYPDLIQAEVLNAALDLMFKPMEKALESSPFLCGTQMSWVDVAIFLFVRQFSMVEPHYFDALALPLSQRWLKGQLDSALFQSIMHKHPTWPV